MHSVDLHMFFLFLFSCQVLGALVFGAVKDKTGATVEMRILAGKPPVCTQALIADTHIQPTFPVSPFICAFLPLVYCIRVDVN